MPSDEAVKAACTDWIKRNHDWQHSIGDSMAEPEPETLHEFVGRMMAQARTDERKHAAETVRKFNFMCCSDADELATAILNGEYLAGRGK